MMKTTVIHNYYQSDPSVKRLLDQILNLLGAVEEDLMTLNETITAIETSASAETDAVVALEKLISDILQSIRDEGVNQSRLTKVLDKIDANRSRLVALALTNTPADPGTPVPPVV